jgi:RNA-binding protein YlmH
MNKVRDNKGDFITNTNEIQMIIREYLKTYILIEWQI